MAERTYQQWARSLHTLADKYAAAREYALALSCYERAGKVYAELIPDFDISYDPDYDPRKASRCREAARQLKSCRDKLRPVEESDAEIGSEGFASEFGNNAAHAPLLRACAAGNVKVVRAALADAQTSGFDAITPNGQTPFHLACKHGRAELVELMLTEASGTIAAQMPDHDGKTQVRRFGFEPDVAPPPHCHPDEAEQIN